MGGSCLPSCWEQARPAFHSQHSTPRFVKQLDFSCLSGESCHRLASTEQKDIRVPHRPGSVSDYTTDTSLSLCTAFFLPFLQEAAAMFPRNINYLFAVGIVGILFGSPAAGQLGEFSAGGRCQNPSRNVGGRLTLTVGC